MITFNRSGVTVLAVSRTGVTIAGIFDSFYEHDTTTSGSFFDGRRCSDGFEVWVGRRHLIMECPPLARFLERFGAPTPTAV